MGISVHSCQEDWQNLNWSSGMGRCTEKRKQPKKQKRRGEPVSCRTWEREDRELERLNLEKFPVSTKLITMTEILGQK